MEMKKEKKWEPSLNDYVIHIGMAINLIVIFLILYYYFLS
jgi:hypothetical protein